MSAASLPTVTLLDPRRLELVKWLAFAAMVADHIDLVWFGRAQPWLHQIGGFAFPAFCVCFGAGLAHSLDPALVARRLVAPALLAQAAWLLIDPFHPVNVLGMFAWCAVLAWAWPTPSGKVLPLATLLVAPMVLEGGVFGPLLVLVGLLAATRSLVWLVFLGLWSLAVPSVGAVAAVAFLLWASSSGPVLPRSPGVLMWAYPAHLGLLVLGAGYVAAL